MERLRLCFFIANLNKVKNNIFISDVFDSIEPSNFRYQSLKSLVKNFVDKTPFEIRWFVDREYFGIKIDHFEFILH